MMDGVMRRQVLVSVLSVFSILGACTTTPKPPVPTPHRTLEESRDEALKACEATHPHHEHVQEIISCENTVWQHWARTVHVGQDVIQPALTYNNVDLHAYLLGRMDRKTIALHFSLMNGVVDNRYKMAKSLQQGKNSSP